MMPMGLTNECATFQRIMAVVLEGLIVEIRSVYLDDKIVFSKSLEEHVFHTNGN